MFLFGANVKHKPLLKETVMKIKVTAAASTSVKYVYQGKKANYQKHNANYDLEVAKGDLLHIDLAKGTVRHGDSVRVAFRLSKAELSALIAKCKEPSKKAPAEKAKSEKPLTGKPPAAKAPKGKAPTSSVKPPPKAESLEKLLLIKPIPDYNTWKLRTGAADSSNVNYTEDHYKASKKAYARMVKETEADNRSNARKNKAIEKQNKEVEKRNKATEKERKDAEAKYKARLGAFDVKRIKKEIQKSPAIKKAMQNYANKLKMNGEEILKMNRERTYAKEVYYRGFVKTMMSEVKTSKEPISKETIAYLKTAEQGDIGLMDDLLESALKGIKPKNN